MDQNRPFSKRFIAFTYVMRVHRSHISSPRVQMNGNLRAWKWKKRFYYYCYDWVDRMMLGCNEPFFNCGVVSSPNQNLSKFWSNISIESTFFCQQILIWNVHALDIRKWFLSVIQKAKILNNQEISTFPP